MSYLEGRKNIYSIISNEVVNYIKDELSLNKQLNKYTQNGQITLEKDMYVFDTRTQPFTGIPQNLVTSTSLYTECGNDDNGVQCIECLKKFDITDADLLPNNYENNIEKINYIKNNQCSGACSCNISNVSLSSHLIFTTGVNINAEDISVNDIYTNVYESMTSLNRNDSTEKSKNWWLTVFGGSRNIDPRFRDATITVSKNVEQEIKKVISNIGVMYAQSINQLITNSQQVVVKGTGIKVHNISIKSLNDITFSASISSCGGEDCVVRSLNDITNSFISEIQENISSQFIDMFKYAFEENKKLIIAAAIFIGLFICIWVFLIFKKATSNK